MSKLNPNAQFGDGDSAEIDKVIAASAIAGYVGGAKMLKTLKGNVDTQDPQVFEVMFEKYRKSHSDVENNVDQIPGFVDRDDKKPIKLRLPGLGSHDRSRRPRGDASEFGHKLSASLRASL